MQSFGTNQPVLGRSECRVTQLCCCPAEGSSGAAPPPAPAGMHITRIQLPPAAAAAGGKLQIFLQNGQTLQMVVPPARRSGGTRRPAA